MKDLPDVKPVAGPDPKTQHRRAVKPLNLSPAKLARIPSATTADCVKDTKAIICAPAAVGMNGSQVMRIELEDCEAVLLREVADPKMKRRHVAVTYAFGLRQGGVRWDKVNLAILNRWSFAGLEWIKTQAWKRISDRGTRPRA